MTSFHVWFWEDHHSSMCSLLHHHPRFLFFIHLICLTSCSFLFIYLFIVTYSLFDTFFTSSLHISLSVQFSSLPLYWYYIHTIFYTCCISYMRAWVLIIGYLGLVSLLFYYPITLAYVTSRVLRPPWGHGIRCHLQQPLLGQVFEIWLIFRYSHASSSEKSLFDVWI